MPDTQIYQLQTFCHIFQCLLSRSKNILISKSGNTSILIQYYYIIPIFCMVYIPFLPISSVMFFIGSFFPSIESCIEFSCMSLQSPLIWNKPLPSLSFMTLIFLKSTAQICCIQPYIFGTEYQPRTS